MNTKKNILEEFPLETPRRNQIDVLKAIEKAYKDGYRNVLLDAPVGSGKSAIAIAAANYFGEAHILTPRKSLQDQYYEDFNNEDVVLMKGRSSYPCTYISSNQVKLYKEVVREITAGKIVTPTGGELSCGEGPCTNSSTAYIACTDTINGVANFPCPYHVAIDVAQQNDTVIHNLHSFIFQAFFTARFQRRKLMVIDECHEVEGIVRGFASKSVTIPKNFRDNELPVQGQYKTLEEWSGYFEQFVDLFGSTPDRFGVTDREKFLNTLQTLDILNEKFGEKFVPVVERDPILRRTKFTFIPERVGDLVNTYLLDFGEKRLLMSGTIYNKEIYCKNVGLNPEETCFIRIGSTFPKANRPIYFKDDYKIDTSHKFWDENYREMISGIRRVFDVFDDVKGLIHTPSYNASQVIFNSLRDTERVMMHTKDDFQEKLQEFYASEEPMVFLSPTCQQGVDFKYDRARFQIILRVPYLNTSDPFVEYKVKNDFPWYNYQALVLFGQQIGRVNRADDDFGVTILMDERFGKFLSRNKSYLPKWVQEAIIYV